MKLKSNQQQQQPLFHHHHHHLHHQSKQPGSAEFSKERKLVRGAVPDMVMLDSIEEQAVLENLRNRYKNDAIYTSIGPVLISVNPFKPLKIYDDRTIQSYFGKYAFELEPHVYAIAEESFRNMVQFRENQCILISGESGAGKTEASKRILEYIAKVSGEGEGVEKVKKQLLDSNPVLESFGNAKTLRNNNSSRFGKYMQIQCDFKGCPKGGHIRNCKLLSSKKSINLFHKKSPSKNKTQLQISSKNHV